MASGVRGICASSSAGSVVAGTSCAESFHSVSERSSSAAPVTGRLHTGASAAAARKRSKNSRKRAWWVRASCAEYRFGLVSKSMCERVPPCD
ncbi:hypothetical protein NN3_15040 [Nocardia neocaledoniensis NBRC 108232]|nr:hypothetical protein NN3_15040 [Nocardia neocaledoniensis NBRC 108232]